MKYLKKKPKNAAGIIFVFITFIFAVAVISLRKPSHSQNAKRIFIPPITDPSHKVTLLAWTAFWVNITYFPEDMMELDCETNNCFFTNNKTVLDRSDAILFHWWDIVNVESLPTKTIGMPTKWVLFYFEPPINSQWSIVEPVISEMNLIVSHRSGSDIFERYGHVRHRRTLDPADAYYITLKDFQNKNDVAWIVSRCTTQSKREDYVAQLKNYMHIEIFGKCGSTSRCQNISYEQCYEQVGKLFKFYLAFENSICVDYATEKVFYPLMKGMVPVVLGGANYSSFLPPNSYIDVFDFNTPKDLADHLRKVSHNFTLYKRYHEWRKDCVVTDVFTPFRWLCKLCNLIYENRVSNATKNKKDFYRWWYNDSKCINLYEKTKLKSMT